MIAAGVDVAAVDADAAVDCNSRMPCLFRCQSMKVEGTGLTRAVVCARLGLPQQQQQVEVALFWM